MTHLALSLIPDRKRFIARCHNKTHGSKFHRAAGSTGMAASPSRVFKGTKMPGRMGFERKTAQNLKVVKIDSEKQVLLVKGAVPGRNNSTVIVKQARKKY